MASVISILLFALLLITYSVGTGTNIFDQLQSHVEKTGKLRLPGASQKAPGEDKSDSWEVEYAVVDNAQVQADPEDTRKAPASLKMSSKTILPLEILEIVGSWFHPEPPHHKAKHVNRSAMIRNLRNLTFIKKLSHNKTLLMRFQKAAKLAGLKSIADIPNNNQTSEADIEKALEYSNSTMADE